VIAELLFVHWFLILYLSLKADYGALMKFDYQIFARQWIGLLRFPYSNLDALKAKERHLTIWLID
jgi:hypothetical protein